MVVLLLLVLLLSVMLVRAGRRHQPEALRRGLLLPRSLRGLSIESRCGSKVGA